MKQAATLSKEQIGLLQKAIFKGMNGAASALSDMIGKELKVTAPDISFIPINDVTDAIGGPEVGVVGIYLAVEGDITGHIMLIFHLKSAFHLADLLLEKAKGETTALDEMDLSALEEVGNITGSFFLSSLGDFVSLELRPSPPSSGVDMAAALLSSVLVDVSKAAEQVLIMETVFSVSDQHIRGFFFLLPEPESLKVLLNSLVSA
jgi:chemotaxis protein CheC